MALWKVVALLSIAIAIAWQTEIFICRKSRPTRSAKSQSKRLEPLYSRLEYTILFCQNCSSRKLYERTQPAHVRLSLAVCPSVYSLSTPRCLRLSSLFSLPETARKRRILHNSPTIRVGHLRWTSAIQRDEQPRGFFLLNQSPPTKFYIWLWAFLHKLSEVFFPCMFNFLNYWNNLEWNKKCWNAESKDHLVNQILVRADPIQPLLYAKLKI